MVLEIALGIVLAVVMLAFLPFILTIGVALLLIAIGIVLIVALGLWLYDSPKLGLALAVYGSAFAVVAAIGYFLTKVTRLALDEAMGVVFLVGIWGLAVYPVIEEYMSRGKMPDSAPWVAFFGIAVVAFLIVVFLRSRNRPRIDGAPRSLNGAGKEEWARRRQLGYTETDQGNG